MIRKYWTEGIKRQIAYRQKYKCAVCQKMLPAAWHADHVIPLSEGGTNHTDNCQILCGSCHADKTMSENIRAEQLRKEARRRTSRFFHPASPCFLATKTQLTRGFVKPHVPQ